MGQHEAPTLVPLGLAGGQGKSTVALITGRILARCGIPVLFVDADPQASLTAFLGVDPGDRPSLIDVFTKPEKRLKLLSAIHTVPGDDNLFLIPATEDLESANHFLAASGKSVPVLRNRLYQVGVDIPAEERVVNNFGVIIIDPPPERSHLALTSLGAGNAWVVPAEANVKGVQSLVRTLQLIQDYQTEAPQGFLAGVIPFRGKWVGLNPTATTKSSMKVMEEIAGAEKMLPNLLESDVYKRAINDQVLPRDLGQPGLEYPLITLIQRIKHLLEPYAEQIPAQAEVALK